MPSVTWVLESGVFPETHAPIRRAVRDAGHILVDWSDDWLAGGPPSHVATTPTLFHGSLGNAAHVAENFDWTPGSFCDSARFRCSAWYDHKREWLIHKRYAFSTVADLVANVDAIASSLDATDSIFVRPDSPLKPFSGRVVNTTGLTLASLDHGFYYDELDLPIVVAPVRNIGREWRFVVVDSVPVAGSAYDAATRSAVPAPLNDAAADFAASIAAETVALANVYVLDVCECDGSLRLMELNPFGGADLYACDPHAIIDSVSRIAAGRCSGG